ncbi:hypothetical protein GWK47_023441 [Chionoecetes opilio]|uniref:Uncharacterized protein n=1 Tax=Chionoecetes opilio TaxID=41210 RepID=A0A8J5CGG4_CHIOP|nr:hypothetical protein GWK47_023441 [Chionoecetes opilio]
MAGNGLHSYSFSPGFAKGSFRAGRHTPHHTPTHWLFRTSVGRGAAGRNAPRYSVVNPNKAVFTIDSTSRILTANDMCSLLLGESEERLCGGSRHLADYISCPPLPCAWPPLPPPHPMPRPHPIPPPHPRRSPQTTLYRRRERGGRGGWAAAMLAVVEGVAAGCWRDQRWVAVLEPVEITQAKATVDHSGAILDHDEAFRTLFAFPETPLHNPAETRNIHTLIPSLQIPPAPSASSPCSPTSVVWWWWMAAGNIMDYNHNFTRFLFGYGAGELDDRVITQIIPTFYEDMREGRDLGYEDEVSTGSYWEEEEEGKEEEEDEDAQKENKNESPSKSPPLSTEHHSSSTAHSQAMRDITNALNSELKPPPQQCLYNTWVDENKGQGVEESKVVGGACHHLHPGLPALRLLQAALRPHRARHLLWRGEA